VREKHCWLAENKRLKAQANKLSDGGYGMDAFQHWLFKFTMCFVDTVKQEC
jgi:hypothetical protein